MKDPEKYFTQGVYSYLTGPTLNPGDCFGEIGIIMKKTRTATMLCLTDWDYLLINRAVFEQFLKPIVV